ncbi:MAG: class II aldolase/adducin family protein [Actinobacteria bacterium]|nr:class II aldolase/adducin family protein [Actinomycetota bacterium]
MRFEAERDLICNVIARLKDWGMLDMTGGAVSMRAADGTILVTPSGTSFRAWQMVPSDVIALSPQGEIVDRSSRLAASGTQLHLAIYETLGDAGAVVHCHAPYSLAFASLGISVPSVTNQADTLGEIPCLIADDDAVKEQVRSGQLTVPVPEGIVQRPDVNAVNLTELIPQLRDHFLPRADEITRHGLAFTIYRHGAVTMARGLYEATENLARVEVSARTALFQAMLRGGMTGIVANPLFPPGESTDPEAHGQARPPVASAQ